MKYTHSTYNIKHNEVNMVDFSALKTRKETASSRFAVIKEQATKSGTFEKKEDLRYWHPTVDEAGNGFAVIRFLDAPEGEDTPWVKLLKYAFKNPANNRWYIENSLLTLGQPDPLAELNSSLWATGTNANKDLVRLRGQRHIHISNILVVTDTKHPENEGKVFLFGYGKKIFEKIKNKMAPPPEFPDEEAMDPFNFWSGANFKVKIRNVSGYKNYDLSEFATPGPIGDDEKINDIWKQCYSLKEEVGPSKFKTYAELKSNLERVLVGDNPGATAETVTPEDTETTIDYETKKQNAPSVKPSKKVKATKTEETEEEEEEDDLSFFTKLAKDDGDPF